MSTAPKHSSKPSSPPPSSGGGGGGDSNDILNIVLGIFALVAMYFLNTSMSAMTPFVYSIFTYLPWMAAHYLGRIGLVLMLLIYAAVCVIVEAIFTHRDLEAAKKGRVLSAQRGRSMLFVALYFFLLAAWHTFASGPPQETGLLWHVSVLCNPEDPGSPYTTCQNGIGSFFGSGFLYVITAMSVPSVLLVALFAPPLIRGTIALSSEHPELSMRKQIKGFDSFLEASSETFPHLKFYKKLNPNKYPFYEGIFARLLRSRTFAVQKGLVIGFIQRPYKISEVRNTGTKPLLSEDGEEDYSGRDNDLVPILDDKKFNTEMLKQLGNPFTGIENLSPAETVIMGTIIGQCASAGPVNSEDRNKAKEWAEKRSNAFWSWLGDVALEKAKIPAKKYTAAMKAKWPDGYDLSALPPIEEYPEFKEYQRYIYYWFNRSEEIKKIRKQHAYTHTMILAMLVRSRDVGTLQPSIFRWLRLYDRTLWALVQNSGRGAVFAENIGSVSHYHAELKAGYRLNKPDFNAAYQGLMERLYSFSYTKEDLRLFEKGELTYIFREDPPMIEFKEGETYEKEKGDINIAHDDDDEDLDY
ncbi:hypothetical protein B0181_07970 [Moraxella caviae]|uniref:DotM C-terminal cytoplasmic domain-containing protein n=1 Tax=Moraxella caviae TaxID=34060 RepID=A0A1S9ZYP2_9GAMM|nr:hypothetical protein [Moraxella caviae]OOR88644.1 hypothetical protein B0181_07970 [Moraxella caviae]STZ13672.1 Uncharacterised protein [Moraxella caviae]